MKIFILSVTAGLGHNASARTLAEEFQSRGAEVVVEDMYKYLSRIMYDIIDKGYIFSINHMPKQFGKTYSRLERHERMRRVVSIINNNRIVAEKMANLFRENMPDVIITTHVFGAQVLNVLKKQGFLRMPVIGIVTDYCIHPFWEEIDCLEHIVTASEGLGYTAALKGMDVDKLLPLGLPVRPNFSKKLDKQEARARLGLEPDKRTVLIMGGSMGYGNMLPVAAQIDAMDFDIQLVCICGNNDKLYKKLRMLKTSGKIYLEGFVNNVDLYMDASDCIVTKPGGLTVTETMAKKLPMILINPIPGQEERNVEFLLNNGAAIRVTKNFSVAEAVYHLFADQSRLNLMEKSIELIAKPDATEKICDFVMGLSSNKICN